MLTLPLKFLRGNYEADQKWPWVLSQGNSSRSSIGCESQQADRKNRGSTLGRNRCQTHLWLQSREGTYDRRSKSSECHSASSFRLPISAFEIGLLLTLFTFAFRLWLSRPASHVFISACFVVASTNSSVVSTSEIIAGYGSSAEWKWTSNRDSGLFISVLLSDLR